MINTEIARIDTTIYFAKVRPDTKIPTKRVEDAGYDIYANFSENYMVIMPHETKMIPTGIASVCSDDYAFILKERGSTGTKGMAQRCGVIDSGFRGEWFVPVTNTNDKPIVIYKNGYKPSIFTDFIEYPYEKAICQAMLIPVPKTVVEEISYEDLQNIKSNRGNGALGSSQK